jgi:hypothetical protein
MKNFLPLFGVSLLAISQSSFAAAEHITKQIGHFSVDIYGYRNTLDQNSMPVPTPIESFDRAEQKCADSQLAELNKAIPITDLGLNAPIIVLVDISNAPYENTNVEPYHTLEIKGKYLYLRPGFSEKNGFCDPFDSDALVQAMNQIERSLPADPTELTSSLDQLVSIAGSPPLPGHPQSSADSQKNVEPASCGTNNRAPDRAVSSSLKGNQQ